MSRLPQHAQILRPIEVALFGVESTTRLGICT